MHCDIRSTWRFCRKRIILGTVLKTMIIIIFLTCIVCMYLFYSIKPSLNEVEQITCNHYISIAPSVFEVVPC